MRQTPLIRITSLAALLVAIGLAALRPGAAQPTRIRKR